MNRRRSIAPTTTRRLAEKSGPPPPCAGAVGPGARVVFHRGGKLLDDRAVVPHVDEVGGAGSRCDREFGGAAALPGRREHFDTLRALALRGYRQHPLRLAAVGHGPPR